MSKMTNIFYVPLMFLPSATTVTILAIPHATAGLGAAQHVVTALAPTLLVLVAVPSEISKNSATSRANNCR